MKEYYRILGLRKTASLEDIKRSYRELVLRYHPDMGVQSDLERFLDIQEAFDILSDISKRDAYDKQIEADKSDSRSVSISKKPGSVSPVFGFGNPWSKRRVTQNYPFGLAAPEPELEPGSSVQIILTPEEARSGCEVDLDVPVRFPCHRCRGYGANFLFVCGTCSGTGFIGGTRKLALGFPPLHSSPHFLEVNLNPAGIRGILQVILRTVNH